MNRKLIKSNAWTNSWQMNKYLNEWKKLNMSTNGWRKCWLSGRINGWINGQINHWWKSIWMKEREWIYNWNWHICPTVHCKHIFSVTNVDGLQGVCVMNVSQPFEWRYAELSTYFSLLVKLTLRRLYETIASFTTFLFFYYYVSYHLNDYFKPQFIEISLFMKM